MIFRKLSSGKYAECYTAKRMHCSKGQGGTLLHLYACTLLAYMCQPPATAEEQEGHLAITAVTVPTKRDQPTWIALKRDGESRLLHRPTDWALISLEPGIYELDHIDIGPKYCRHTNSEPCEILRFPSEKKEGSKNQFRSIEVRPEMVTIYGTLTLKVKNYGTLPFGVRRTKYDIELNRTSNFFSWLCTHQQENLKNNLAYILEPGKGYKTIKINCIYPEPSTSDT